MKQTRAGDSSSGKQTQHHEQFSSKEQAASGVDEGLSSPCLALRWLLTVCFNPELLEDGLVGVLACQMSCYSRRSWTRFISFTYPPPVLSVRQRLEPERGPREDTDAAGTDAAATVTTATDTDAAAVGQQLIKVGRRRWGGDQ